MGLKWNKESNSLCFVLLLPEHSLLRHCPFMLGFQSYKIPLSLSEEQHLSNLILFTLENVKIL